MTFNKRKKNIEKTLVSITKKIIDRYNPQKIILFGSYAYGSPKRDSDIDLLIIKKTNAKHIDRAVKIREILREENSMFALEPLIYTPQEVNERLEMEDDFMKNIIEKGVILYG
ncbi:nucleotidyltransferase domain-containing protein [Candidatus Woesearchaeota archaeon]|nr:nucleotidyltransferase domain-containing protein [Candidatus Woesearchaeota archaeon]